MSNWIVENRLTGVVEYAYGADLPAHFDTYPLADYNHVLQKQVDAEPQRRVTKLEFVTRLGNDYIPLLAASKQSVMIEAFIKMLDWATPEQDGTSIDLDDPRLIDALTQLEQGGAIAEGRATEILA